MYNLVIKNVNRNDKAGSVAKYLRDKYPETITVSKSIIECDRNIVLTQTPWFYKKIKVGLIFNAIHFLRPAYVRCYKNSATNGFSIFKLHEEYKYFIPMMYEYKITSKSINDIIIGYYYAPYRNTLHQFLNFIKENAKQIKNVLILGDRPEVIFKIKDINKNINVNITNDKDSFFFRITHLVTPKSKTFVDPWPTVLEEGVRCNKQIIILNTYRGWKDGIDDICSCIKYHTKLNLNKYYDNSESSINKFDLDKFYNYLFNNNFEFYIDRSKYKTFDAFLNCDLY
jgi:hypothetical protein